MHNSIEMANAMMVALNQRDRDRVRKLLDDGFDCDEVLRASDRYTALHFAAACGYSEGCRLLIQRGADVNALCSLGVGPLHIGANAGSLYSCERLIAAGADVHVRCHKGETALHWAAIGGSAVVCQLLLEQGLDPNAEDRLGLTPLHYAANPEVFACLLESGADPMYAPARTTKDYLTPFQHAVQRVWGEQVKLCLDRGSIDLEQKTLDGRSLIDLTGRRRLVKDLLRKARAKALEVQA